MKLVRALLAVVAALAVGATVQLTVSSPASAASSTQSCVYCWDIIER